MHKLIFIFINYLYFSSDKDYTKGILQTIGFKEFLPYLNDFDKSNDEQIVNYFNNLISNPDENSKPDGCELFLKCLDELKLVTQRYSKKQIKWIRNRLLAAHDRQVPALYDLNTTDPSQWNSDIFVKAENIIQSYIENTKSNYEPMEKVENPRLGLKEDVTYTCDVCDRVFIGEYQYQLHMKSNKHKKSLKRKHKSDE